jgi:hypothetical protein
MMFGKKKTVTIIWSEEQQRILEVINQDGENIGLPAEMPWDSYYIAQNHFEHKGYEVIYKVDDLKTKGFTGFRK